MADRRHPTTIQNPACHASEPLANWQAVCQQSHNCHDKHVRVIKPRKGVAEEKQHKSEMHRGAREHNFLVVADTGVGSEIALFAAAL
jgi:hypothetical protein